VAEARHHGFASRTDVDERQHCILLFTREFHEDLKVYMFRSDRLSERLQLVGREVEEILLVHPSGTRSRGDGSWRWRGDGSGGRCISHIDVC